MFKLSIPITKSYKSKTKKNVLVIEGIASDSSIDRDSERFSELAVKNMQKAVSEGNIPIRVEHEDKIFSEIGKWTEGIMDGGKLFVKGEIDLDFSMGKDIKVLIEKGYGISLSVGGMVKEAFQEFNKDLGKMIKVYEDILLNEISIVKHAANYNATLSLAKSYNFKDKIETVEGQELSKNFLYNNYLKSINNKTIQTARDITSDEVELMKKCVEYKTTKNTRPQFGGNDLSDVEVNQLAKAYGILIERNILKTNSNKTMKTKEELEALIAKSTAELEKLNEVEKSTETVGEVEKEEIKEEVIEVKKEVVEEEIKEEVIEEEKEPKKSAKKVENEVKKSTETVEGVSKEETVVDEASKKENSDANTTKNKTSTDEGVLKAIEAIKVSMEENAINTTKSIADLTKKISDIEESNIEAVNKSVKAKADKETADIKILEGMTKSIKAISEKVVAFGKTSNVRKSQVAIISKEGNTEKSTEDLILEKMATNGGSLSRARSEVLAK